jgi:hypothetical protein
MLFEPHLHLNPGISQEPPKAEHMESPHFFKEQSKPTNPEGHKHFPFTQVPLLKHGCSQVCEKQKSIKVSKRKYFNILFN